MHTELVKSHCQRMQVIKFIREYFDRRGFQELWCPLLSESVPAEPTIYPFATTWDRQNDKRLASKTLYLPISPERAMKKYLSLGFEECYSIGSCLRNMEGTSSTHHPEFLMLEWYRVGSDYQQIIDDTVDLIQRVNKQVNNRDVLVYQGKEFDIQHWQRRSVEDIWQEKWQTSLGDLQTLEAMRRFTRERGYSDDGTWEEMFNQIFLNDIEPEFDEQPFVLLDFPAVLSPLCRPRADKPWLAERFEVYIDGIELGNGNSEQLDADAIERIFRKELHTRQRHGVATQPLDTQMLDTIRQMAAAGKQYAGMGLGVDRLAMMIADVASISDWWPSFD